MRVAYLACVSVDREAGVLRKVLTQCRSWRHAGLVVRLYLVTDRPSAALADAGGGAPPGVFPHDGTRRGFRQALMAAGGAIAADGPDLLYHRFFRCDPVVHGLLKCYPSALEINSDDLREYRLTLPLPSYLLHVLRRRRFLRSARMFVTVTQELAQRLAHLRRPTLVLANGVDLAHIEPLPAAPNTQPAVCFIGTPGQPWHGLDFVLDLADHFPGWSFHVIGPDGRDTGCGRAGANVVCYGYLKREQYLPILSRCDIGIGTMGLYRTHMHEACPLKTREYLGHGLPVIIGYQDTDFPQPVPFILRLPNRPLAVSSVAREVEEFAKRWVGTRVARAEVAAIGAGAKAEQFAAFVHAQLKPHGSV